MKQVAKVSLMGKPAHGVMAVVLEIGRERGSTGIGIVNEQKGQTPPRALRCGAGGVGDFARVCEKTWAQDPLCMLAAGGSQSGGAAALQFRGRFADSKQNRIR